MVEEIGQQALQIFADFIQILESLERHVGITINDGIRERRNFFVGHQSEDRQHILFGNLIAA